MLCGSERRIQGSVPFMNNNRVFNLTRGYSLKHKQALRAVDQCSATWIEFGISIRDLTLAEAIAARNAQAKLQEAFPLTEIPGLRYEAPETKRDSEFWEKRVEAIRATGAFVSNAIQ
jgi:hypothetical protein